MLYNTTIPFITAPLFTHPKISKQKDLVNKLSETFQGGRGGGNTLSFDPTLRKRQHVSQRGRGVHQSLRCLMFFGAFREGLEERYFFKMKSPVEK